MRHILEGEGLRELIAFASSNVLLALDFDGTLAPLVSSPQEASLASSTRLLLSSVASAFKVAVISGRTEVDLRQRLTHVTPLEILGNHGLEPLRQLVELELRVGLWRRELASFPFSELGVELEDKKYALALHYRHSADPDRAHAAIREASAKLEAARIIDGKFVVNLVPEGAPHKGMGLVSLRERLGCERAIYVGDDTADEDVFLLKDQDWLLPIHVGEENFTHSRFFLRSQGEMDAFLRTLIWIKLGQAKGPQPA